MSDGHGDISSDDKQEIAWNNYGNLGLTYARNSQPRNHPSYRNQYPFDIESIKNIGFTRYDDCITNKDPKTMGQGRTLTTHSGNLFPSTHATTENIHKVSPTLLNDSITDLNKKRVNTACNSAASVLVG